MIANTKGFTGHAMGTGIEDVVAVKALETGCVPPVANFKEVDPELGPLNLSKGGAYPVEYAIRLGAGFGSQISMTLLHWVTTKDGVRPSPNALGYAYRIADADAWSAWLSRIAGHPAADLEVVHRTLRVRDQAAAARVAEAARRPHGAGAHVHRASTAQPRRSGCEAGATAGADQLTEAKGASSRRCASPPDRPTSAAKGDPVKETSAGSGSGENRLSRRHAGSGSRSRSRPGRRHR